MVERPGRGADRGPRAPARCARPTRPASATPSGPASSPGSPGGSATGAAPRSARCWPPTSSRRSAPRSTSSARARFLARLAEAYGDESAAEIEPHLSLPAPPESGPPCRSSRPASPWRFTLDQVDSRRGPRRRRCRPRAGHPAGGLPRRPVPDGGGRPTAAAARVVVTGPARRAAAGRPAGQPVAAASSRRTFEIAGRHRLRARSSPRAPTPAGTGGWITPAVAARLRRAAPARLGALGRDLARRRAGRRPVRRWRSAACSPASRCSTTRPTPRRWRWSRSPDLSSPTATPAPDRRAVGHPAPGEPGHLRGAARGLPAGGSPRPCPCPARALARCPRRVAARVRRCRRRSPTTTVKRWWSTRRRRPRRSPTQLVPAHPAPGRYVVPAAGSVASTVDHGARCRPRVPPRPAGSPAAGSAGRARHTVRPRSQPGRPELRPAPSATASGSTARNRVDVGLAVRCDARQRQGDPHVAVGEHAHRGEHVAGLERAGRAGRARRHREAPPVELGDQRLTVDVQAGEGHHVRQPVARVADDLGVGDARRGRAGSGRRARRLARARRRGSPRSAARPPRRPGRGRPPARRRCARPPARWPARRGATGCARAPPAPRRRRGRPTSARRRRARRTTWAPARRPSDAIASTSSGTPWARVRWCTAASGWRVPTSPLALCTAAAVVPGRARALSSASRSTRPRASTRTSSNSDGSPDVAARWRPRVRTPECSTADATSRVPRRRPACISPSQPARRATGPDGRKDSSGGRTPSPAATTSRARSSSARACRPSACSRRGSAHPASRAASSVSRAAGSRGVRGRVEQRPGGGCGRSGRHTPTVARP